MLSMLIALVAYASLKHRSFQIANLLLASICNNHRIDFGIYVEFVQIQMEANL